MKETVLHCEQKHHGQRLDRVLAELLPDNSRSYLQKLIKNGHVCCNDEKTLIPKLTISFPCEIRIQFPEEISDKAPIAENIDLPVIFEDDDLLVINKPPGIVVHPAAGNWTGTVVNALLGRDGAFAHDFSETPERPGIVHRLDKDTSGCLIVAKNPQSQYKLSKSFQNREVSKTYAAITYGIPEQYQDELVTLIGRHPVNRKKMAVVTKNGKEAITRYEVMEQTVYDQVNLGLLRVKILTGRTHQIRVHMAYLKAPILGDEIYGGHQKITVPRQLLHAWKLAIPHPTTKQMLYFKSPFPDDFKPFFRQAETGTNRFSRKSL